VIILTLHFVHSFTPKKDKELATYNGQYSKYMDRVIPVNLDDSCPLLHKSILIGDNYGGTGILWAYHSFYIVKANLHKILGYSYTRLSKKY